MTKERLEKIKENVYTRCSIANTTSIGLTAPDKEEVELLDEIERLNKIINGLKVSQKNYRISQLKLINDFKRRYELISSNPPTSHLLRCLQENLTLYSCKMGVLEILEGSDKL